MARHKSYAVFDIDGTLVRWQLYHALADLLTDQKLISPQDYQPILELRQEWHNRLSNDAYDRYEQRLIKLLDQVLDGINYDLFLEGCKQVCDQHKDQVYAYTRNLIKELRARDYLVFAISASPVELVANIAGYYGFSDFAGSQRMVVDHKLTKKNSLLFGEAKKTKLIKLINQHQAIQANSIGVGDTIGDSYFLDYVKQPIAFNPSQSLFDYAKQNKWQVVIERKNIIYNLEMNSYGQYILADTK